MRPNLTLALLSAALTAALFLLVLLLVEGWRHSPATAALTVSVVPVAALAARPLARVFRPPPEVEVAVGCFLIAGGLVGLALLPSADLAWTVAPQALVGLGLGLTVDRLTSQAMELRLPAGRARGLDHRRSPPRRGRRAGDPDAGVHRGPPGRPGARPGGDHLAGARRPADCRTTRSRSPEALGDELTEQQGQVPDLHRAFVAADLDARRERPAAAELERDLDDQLERAATRAFRDSFLIGAGLALLALLTVVAPRRRRTP